MKRSLVLTIMLVAFFSCSSEQNNSLVNIPNDSDAVVSEKKASIIDSSLIDTLELDSINSDTNTNDTLEVDTVKTDTIKIDTILKDTIGIDTILNDTAEFDSLELYKDSECIGCEPFRYFSDTIYNKFLANFRNKYAIDNKTTRNPQKSSAYKFTLNQNSYFSKVTVWQEMNYLNVEVISNVFKRIKVYVTATPNPTEEDFEQGYIKEFEKDFSYDGYNTNQINMIGLFGSNKNYYIHIIGIDELGKEYRLSDYLEEVYITIYVPKYFTLQDEKYEDVTFGNLKNRSEAFGDWVLLGGLEDDFIVYDTNGILDTLKVSDRKIHMLPETKEEIEAATININNLYYGENKISWSDDCKILLEAEDGVVDVLVGINNDTLYLYNIREIPNEALFVVEHKQVGIMKYARRNLFTENL